MADSKYPETVSKIGPPGGDKVPNPKKPQPQPTKGEV